MKASLESLENFVEKMTRLRPENPVRIALAGARSLKRVTLQRLSWRPAQSNRTAASATLAMPSGVHPVPTLASLHSRPVTKSN